MLMQRNAQAPQHRPQPRVLAALLSWGAGLCMMANVQAQSYPSKPIRWVVVAPAGSSLDVIARAMQDRLKDNLGQPVVIENKPQAGGTLGTHEVAKSAPDGYTWALSYNGPLSFAPYLYPKLPYQPLKDLQPVMTTTSQPNVIAANAQLPVNTMREAVALLQASPGKYNFASVGNGSSSHLTMEYIKAVTHTYAVHIPFNGSPPAVIATMAGETQFIISVPTVISPQVKQGRLKYLAVTSAQRYPLLPDVPTVAESGMPELRGFEALAWNGVLVAAGTPRAVVDRINSALNAALHDAAVKERLKAAGLDPMGGTPEQFAKLIHDESIKWAPIIKRSGARID
ncbi:tripartite tricarboxylate transporter substrate binding protein [Limnohabitans sp.]|uniref:Bug family tripartite tricarboxylate transporter substrate binding protein n=1 Tax=Limnohabitans sp. TaxID=1907725 RepID=UPI00286EC6F2|nr:tripartite tricarboxylate transporter substrate binding protein [Limnohabitans sp.]